MADIQPLAAPYFYQVRDQKPLSGPLVLDKATLAPQVPIVVSAVSDTTQVGDTITLFFDGKQLGDSLLVKDPNELVYDLLIEPDAWPEATANVHVTVTRNATAVVSSTPVSLQVMTTARTGDVQRHEGFVLGTYSRGVVDTWLVSGAYSITSAAQMPVSVFPTGQNNEGAVIELVRVMRSATGGIGLPVVCMWQYLDGVWQGGFWPSGNELKLARGDQLAMIATGPGPTNLALEFVI